MQRNRLFGESWGEKNRNRLTQNSTSKTRSVSFCTLLSAENEVWKIYFVLLPPENRNRLSYRLPLQDEQLLVHSSVLRCLSATLLPECLLLTLGIQQKR